MSSTQQTPEERYRKEAEELYPLNDNVSAYRLFNEIQTACRNAYIAGRSKSAAELSTLRAELEEVRKQNEWVSVTYSHPEDVTKIYISVLAFDGFERFVCLYSLVEKRFATDRNVTHWRNLPQPPKH